MRRLMNLTTENDYDLQRYLVRTLNQVLSFFFVRHSSLLFQSQSASIIACRCPTASFGGDYSLEASLKGEGGGPGGPSPRKGGMGSARRLE